MAQKSRKQARRTTEAARATVETTPSAPAQTFTGGSGRSFTSEFNPDYSQTIKDLKRIAILAGTFFAILVVLAFVLQ